LPAEPGGRILVHRIEVLTLSRHRQRLVARLLALALLVAQFGAEAHAYSHLAKDPDGTASSSQYCTKCLSYAPVTIAAGGMPQAVLIDQPASEPALAAATASIPSLTPRSSYQSRAPPQSF
jgi:hypothetical protein